ncbi:MAG: pseudouridine synthase, RluA family [Gammaproteobacteria bacterium]|jgi:23S rRNA pseudouridine955/2504/2580 synthase|nr:pseudouridine synthase, RluA family [Gammaproteobacteria bacterium]
MNNKVQYLTVDAEHEGQRLDNFLLRHLKGVPKSHLYKVIRKGEVRINKKRCDVSDRLHEGDSIRIPPIRVEASAEKITSLIPSQTKLLEDSIIFENDHFIVINKPCGLAVHGGSGITLGLIEMLRLFKPHYKNCELAHRLDRETSGCMLVAKKMSALRVLHELFREGKITKIYTALVKGYWPAKLRYIDARLERDILQSGERMVKVTPKGQEAATTFRVLQRFKETTLMSAELHTGRTHQIRVHTLHAGHPIIGDEKYGDKEFNKHMAKQGIKRLCLHATRLSFVWPESQEKFEFEVPVPEVFLFE